MEPKLKELPEDLEARLEMLSFACWRNEALLPSMVHCYVSYALTLDGLGYETGHHLPTALAYQEKAKFIHAPKHAAPKI